MDAASAGCRELHGAIRESGDEFILVALGSLYREVVRWAGVPESVSWHVAAVARRSTHLSATSTRFWRTSQTGLHGGWPAPTGSCLSRLTA